MSLKDKLVGGAETGLIGYRIVEISTQAHY